MVVISVVAVVGCGGGVEKPAAQVSVQLRWMHQTQFAGFYAADQKGFYTEESVGVTLRAGDPDILPSKMVADLISGETNFAIVGAEHLLKARAQGKPVVAIATIFQKNPLVYVSLKSSGIERPQDLVGKRVMVSADGEIQHQALLKRLGIDPDTIELIPFERSVTPLATGQIDAHMLYRTVMGLAFEEEGYEVNFIWLDDYGVHFYADTIVASEELIQQDPELVERFLRATLKGWYYAIENPAEVLDMTLQYDATLDREHQVRMMETQTPLIHTGEAEIGRMEDSVWQRMHQMLLDGGVLTQSINMAEVYTTEFLNKIYGRAEQR